MTEERDEEVEECGATLNAYGRTFTCDDHLGKDNHGDSRAGVRWVGSR